MMLIRIRTTKIVLTAYTHRQNQIDRQNIDLSLWAEIEEVKINQHVMAQAIFPDAYSVGSDIDPIGKLKTTKKTAKSLMDFTNMYLLWLQGYE